MSNTYTGAVVYGTVNLIFGLFSNLSALYKDNERDLVTDTVTGYLPYRDLVISLVVLANYFYVII